MSATYLYSYCYHSLYFLSLCLVSVLSWGQKIRSYEQGESDFSFPTARVVGLLLITSLIPYGWQTFLFHLGHT
jgi:hypothetical protein